jgi:hypothetical protein
MPSFLKFYLDLEANGQIIVPQYTTNGAYTHIKITSDVDILEIYDLKIVDSQGVEHLYSSIYPNAMEYELEMILSDFPLGITTVYASILDAVYNRAILQPKTFEIFKSTLLFIKLSDSTDYKISLSDSFIQQVKLSDSKPYKILLSDKGDWY